MARPKGTTGNAKERIEREAMRLFATKGYAATTTKDIAEAAGIKDASIYNHFKGKRDLFESVVEGELRHLTEVLGESGAMADPADSSDAYKTLDVALLAPVVLDSFRPLFADERIVSLRHMLEADRYEDGRCGELFRESLYREAPGHRGGRVRPAGGGRRVLRVRPPHCRRRVLRGRLFAAHGRRAVGRGV